MMPADPSAAMRPQSFAEHFRHDDADDSLEGKTLRLLYALAPLSQMLEIGAQLDAMDEFKRVLVVGERLRRLAPAAIEDGVCGRDARRWRRLGVAHHANEHIQRGARMRARQGSDFSDGFGHGGLSVSWSFR